MPLSYSPKRASLLASGALALLAACALHAQNTVSWSGDTSPVPGSATTTSWTVDGWLLMGNSGNATGALTLSGVWLTANDYTLVGYAGTGSLQINSGTLSGQTVHLGEMTSGTGTLTVANGALSLSHALIAGGQGAGSVYISGGQVTAFNLALGYNSGASGRFEMTGGTVTLVGGLTVGYSGSGAATLSGGTLSAQEGITVNSMSSLRMNGAAVSAYDLNVYGTGPSLGATLSAGTLSVTNLNVGDTDAAGQMHISGGVSAIQSLLVRGASAGDGALFVENHTMRADNASFLAGASVTFSGASLSAQNSVAIEGTLHLSGGQLETGSLVFYDGGALAVSNGTLSATGGVMMTGSNIGAQMVLQNTRTTIGGFSVQTGALTVSGGAMTVSGGMSINNGTSSLHLENATVQVRDHVQMGLGVGDDAALKLNGGTLLVLGAYTSYIGWGGKASLHVLGGTASFAGELVVNSADTATLTVAGGALSVSGNLTLGGLGGAETFFFQGGSASVGNSIFLGNTPTDKANTLLVVSNAARVSAQAFYMENATLRFDIDASLGGSAAPIFLAGFGNISGNNAFLIELSGLTVGMSPVSICLTDFNIAENWSISGYDDTLYTVATRWDGGEGKLYLDIAAIPEPGFAAALLACAVVAAALRDRRNRKG